MTPQLPPAQIARAAAVRVAYDVTDYGNVPALLDVAEWVLTGQRPAELLPVIESPAVDDDQPHTWVIAHRQDAGRDWCRNNNVPPYAAHTHIITTADAIHGHAIRPTDRVVFVGDVDAIADDVRFGVQLAQRAGGAL